MPNEHPATTVAVAKTTPRFSRDSSRRVLVRHVRFADVVKGTRAIESGIATPAVVGMSPTSGGCSISEWFVLRRFQWNRQWNSCGAATEHSPRRQPWVTQFERAKPRSGER